MVDFNYKIGIVGSTGAGKTALIMACYMAFRDQLKGKINIKPKDTTTQGMLDIAEKAFKSCVPHKDATWTPPRFDNTSDIHTYDFLITFTACNQKHNLNLTIKDYPGSMLGEVDFAKEITPFLLECNAIFLPIPADILMQWHINKDNPAEEAQKRCMIARDMLNDKAACRVVDNWMSSKARNKQPAQLFFVPVRCEKYFSDNETKSADKTGIISSLYKLFIKTTKELFTHVSENELFKAVDEVYYQQLNYTSGMAEYVSVITSCVDTYGIVEECQMDVRNDKLVPQFKRRNGMGRLIKIKNAFELLASTFLFQMGNDQQNLSEELERLNNDLEKANMRLQDLKKNRSFWQALWGNTPQINTAQDEINNLADKIKIINNHLSIINFFINNLNHQYVINNQRTKIYNPETD